MRTLNKREFWLLTVLLISLFIAMFILLRIQPARQQLMALNKSQQKIQKKINKEQAGNKSRGSVKALKKELDALKVKISTESKTMAGYQQSFIDLQQNQKQADLKAKITGLISAEGMVISGIGEDSKSLDELVNSQSQNHSSVQEIKRPMISLELSGTFGMLNNFFQQLEDLPYSVVITRLAMSAAREENLRAPYQLNINLSLAL